MITRKTFYSAVVVLLLINLSYSQNCDLPGCATCTTTSPLQCQKCRDTYTSTPDKSNPNIVTCACVNKREIMVQNVNVCMCETQECASCVFDLKEYCSKCNDGFFFDQSTMTCVACDASCQTCSGAAKYQCESCKLDTQVLAYGSCKTKCAAGQGFQSGDGSCVACLDKSCQDCGLDHSKCSACLEGFYLDQASGSCKACDVSCKTCTGAFNSNCTVCQDGYFLDQLQQVCSACNTTCKTCTESSSKCTSCLKETQILVFNSCQTKCEPGFGFQSGDGNCVACNDQNCAECGLNHSQCTACKVGYDQDTTSSAACSVCAAGYGIDLTNNSCKACADGCLDCAQDANTCAKCSEKYVPVRGICKIPCEAKFGFLDGAGACTACKDVNCQDCSLNNLNCTTCASPLLLVNKICTKCDILNCGVCGVSSTGSLLCKECAAGFVLDSTGTKCITPPVCKAGTGLSADNVCVPCTDLNCGACAKAAVCDTCKVGYFKNSQGTCELCSLPNCALCAMQNSSLFCEKCNDGFVKSGTDLKASCIKTCDVGLGWNANKVCEKCLVADCANCATDNTKCAACTGSLILFGGKCNACTFENCLTCSSSDTGLFCQECKLGYKKDSLNLNAQCVLDPTVCQLGQGQNADGACVACENPYCTRCGTNFAVCEACKEGLVLFKGKCQVCNFENCLTCSNTDTALFCKACKEGYVKSSNLIDAKCVLPPSTTCSLPGCTQCDAITGVCSACKQGMKLGQVNGKQACYTPSIIEGSTNVGVLECGRLIPNCGSCVVKETNIVCEKCLVSADAFCKEGDFYLKADLAFSSCVKKFELVECQMEGCAACSIRKTFHDTCPTTTVAQCLKPLDGYQILVLKGQRIAVLNDLTKYDNINLKSPIPNCSALSTQLRENVNHLVCKQCASPYTVNTEMNTCVLNDCFTKFTNCKSCTAEKCSECAFGYIVSSIGQCTKEELNCSTIAGCTVCKKNPDTTTNTAQPLLCGACSEGYVLKDAKCEKCGDACFTTPTVKCLPNCGSCANEKECLTCASGFTNAPFCNTCEKDDLKFIPEKFVCAPKCFLPEVYDASTKACSKPATLENCVRFVNTSTGALSCEQCTQGFGRSYATGSNIATCKLCTVGCIECKFDGTTEYCGTCAAGYTMVDSVCKVANDDGTVVTTPVQECDPNILKNCAKCFFKETVAVCTTCKDTFKLTNNGECIQPCSELQYIDLTTKTCAECSVHNCAKGCRPTSTGAVVCNEGLCKDGYYFVKEKLACVQKPASLNCLQNQFIAGDVCKDCPAGCSYCKSATYCGGCIEGFTFDPTTSTCFKNRVQETVAVTCLTNCATCKVANLCVECKEGYLLSEKKDQCITKITSCPEGSFLKGNVCRKCSEAQENCTACAVKEGQFFCTAFVKKTECAPTQMKIVLGADNFTCVDDKTCLEFDHAKNNDCLKCRNGSTPVPMDANKPDSRKVCKTCLNQSADGVCITCPENCLECNQSTTLTVNCTKCAPRFDLKENRCVKTAVQCESPMVRNANTNSCECPYMSKRNAAGVCECVSGMVWNSTKTEGCKKPEGTDCEVGLRKEGDGSCVACTSNIIDDQNPNETYGSKYCAACSGDICEKCREGSFLVKEKNACQRCPAGCAACASSDKCLRCEAGKMLTNGKCNDSCDAGTIPSIKSYWTMNKSLFSSLADSDIYQKTVLKPDVSITTIDKCGEPIAIGEQTFCSLDTTVKLPFSTQPSPIDVATKTPITLECLPCLSLCKTCIAGLILDPNGNKCVRQCPLGFAPQVNEKTGQNTCTASISKTADATTVKLETRAHLESRLPETLRGFAAQNVFQRAKIYIKNTLPNDQLSHTLKLDRLYLLGEGQEKEPVPEEKLTAAEDQLFASLASQISSSFKADGNTLWLPANFFKANYIYKLTVVTVKYDAEKKIQAEAVSTVLIAAIERETVEKLSGETAEVSVSSEKVFALDKVCASLIIKDLVNYAKTDKFLVSISYRQAYTKPSDVLEPNQVTESTFENVFCFNAPYVGEKEITFQVNYKLSFNGVHRTAERFFTVIPKPVAQADLDAKLKEAKAVTDSTATAPKTVDTAKLVDLVSIITVKTEDKIGTAPKEQKPTDAAATTTVDAKPNEKYCSVKDPEATCNKQGKCELVNRVPVCKCNEGYDPVTNCLNKWTTEQAEAIQKANEQLTTVLDAAVKQATSTDTKSNEKLTDSTKVEIAAKILTVPIQDPAVAQKAVELIATITASKDLPAQKVVQALSMAARTIKKLTRTTKTGGRMLLEAEITEQDKELDRKNEEILEKVLDKMESDSNDEGTTNSEITTEAFKLNVAKVEPITDPKTTFVQQEFALRGDTGKPSVVKLPADIFKGKKNASVRSFTKTKNSIPVDPKFAPAKEFDLTVVGDTTTSATRRGLAPRVEVKNLEKPIEICPDITQLSASATSGQSIQFRYLKTTIDPVTNKKTESWSSEGVAYNAATKCFEAKHLSYFSIGLGETEITDGNNSAAPTPATDGSTANSLPPSSNTKPEAIGVDSVLLNAFYAALVILSFFAFAF